MAAPKIEKRIAPASQPALAVQSPLRDRIKTDRPIRSGALFAHPYNRRRTPPSNERYCFLCSVAHSEFCGTTRKRESVPTPLLVVGLCGLASGRSSLSTRSLSHAPAKTGGARQFSWVSRGGCADAVDVQVGGGVSLLFPRCPACFSIRDFFDDTTRR